MRLGDQQLGTPQALYKGTQAAVEALTGVPEGAVAYATDLNQLGTYDGASWTWGSGVGGVASVSGDGVDNSDPLNPAMTFPTPGDIGAATSAQGALADTSLQPGDLPTDITPKDGWIADANTWSFSSADSPTGIISINADMTQLLYEKMRISITQDQALTAYFPLDASSTPFGAFFTTDTAMTYTSGKFSGAATFNGTTSKIVVTDASLLKPTGDFTLGCWFKTSTTGVAKSIFISYSANTAIAGFYVRVTAANVLTFGIGKNTGTTLGADYSAITGTTVVTDGSWHYVVFTFRNNFIQIYLDGVLETSGYSFAPAYAGTNYVRIGSHADAGTDNAFFNGQIDDLFLINGYALDEITIRAKYLANTSQGPNNFSLEKFGLISQVGAYSGGTTLVTAYFGTDYMLTNATISSPKYSNTFAPARFTTKESKWSVLVTSSIDHSKTTPTSSAYYGGSLLTPTGPSIIIPIGAWWIAYKVLLGSTYTVAAVGAFGMRATLSTANNTQSDSDLSVLQTIVTPITTSGAFRFTAQTQKPLPLILKVKTTLYLNLFQGSVTAGDVASFLGSIQPTIILATSALL